MSHNEVLQMQDQNTAKLVMNTFYKVAGNDGVTADEITRYNHIFGHLIGYNKVQRP